MGDAPADVVAANARVAEEQAARRLAEQLADQRNKALGEERSARSAAETGLAAALAKAELAAKEAQRRADEATRATKRAEVGWLFYSSELLLLVVAVAHLHILIDGCSVLRLVLISTPGVSTLTLSP